MYHNHVHCTDTVTNTKFITHCQTFWHILTPFFCNYQHCTTSDMMHCIMLRISLFEK
jgi:hypothetical protein